MNTVNRGSSIGQFLLSLFAFSEAVLRRLSMSSDKGDFLASVQAAGLIIEEGKIARLSWVDRYVAVSHAMIFADAYERHFRVGEEASTHPQTKRDALELAVEYGIIRILMFVAAVEVNVVFAHDYVYILRDIRRLGLIPPGSHTDVIFVLSTLRARHRWPPNYHASLDREIAEELAALG